MKLSDFRDMRTGEAMQRGGAALALHRALAILERAVNAECSCGGCGPSDPQACQACMVWHRTMAAEIALAPPPAQLGEEVWMPPAERICDAVLDCGFPAEDGPSYDVVEPVVDLIREAVNASRAPR